MITKLPPLTPGLPLCSNGTARSLQVGIIISTATAIRQSLLNPPIYRAAANGAEGALRKIDKKSQVFHFAYYLPDDQDQNANLI
jgi:hypothetical protein